MRSGRRVDRSKIRQTGWFALNNGKNSILVRLSKAGYRFIRFSGNILDIAVYDIHCRKGHAALLRFVRYP